MQEGTTEPYEYTCQHCGASASRIIYRRKPKYCSNRCKNLANPHRKLSDPKTCIRCGAGYSGWGEKYCSRKCQFEANTTAKEPKDPFDPRGPLLKAYDAGDVDGFFGIIESRSIISSDGCWLWPRLVRGYPIISLRSKKSVPLHRLVLEVKEGAPLGSQAAHHACGNSACVNPRHLQPVTQAHRGTRRCLAARCPG